MTKALILRITLILAALGLIVSPAIGEDTEDLLQRARLEGKNALQVFYSAYTGDAEVNAEAAVRVPPRVIELPHGKLTLDGGWLIPIDPEAIDPEDVPEGLEVPDRESVAGVYVGTGRFEWVPPNATERWMMNFHLSDIHPAKKYHDLDVLDIAISDGVVIAYHGSWKELFAEGTEAGTPEGKTVDVAKRLWRTRGDMFHGSMGRTATIDAFDQLAGSTDELILDVATDDIKGAPALTYQIEDTDNDEGISLVVLRRYALNKDSIEYWPLGTWFHPNLAGEKTDRELAQMRLEKAVDISHYDMDMTVYKDPDVGYWGMKVTGTVDMTVVDDETSILSLAMMNYGENEFDPSAGEESVQKLSGSNRVITTSVTDGDGLDLEFMHNNHTLTVLLPRVYKKGETLQLQFAYHGLFIVTIKQPMPTGGLSSAGDVAGVDIINYRVPNDYPWFPQNGSHNDGFTFDWTLRLPTPMLAATSGNLTGLSTEGKYKVHTISETTEVTFPAIIFGRFNVIENDPDYDKGEYKIRLYLHPGFEKEAQWFLDTSQGVIQYYEAMFGPYPFQELDIAQMPIGIGYAQAPAGLVQMDGRTYMSKTDMANFGYSENALLIRDNFIPHEIAHEWWGHKAGWGSSRDQWVSETFAEYAAALYIEEREKLKSGDEDDTSGYDDRKIRWGRDGRLGHTFTRTGPLWGGNRTGPRRTSTLYARGPLILDMLRTNFGKEAVIKMMFAWCQLADQHDGKVLTEDLQLVLEQVIPGVGFQEFMDSYIKGNAPLPDDPRLNKADKLGEAKY